MSIKGNVREQKESKPFEIYCGFTEITGVLTINPTISERNKLLDKEDSDDDKEFVYVDENQNGNERVHIDFYLKCHKEEVPYIRHRITLENETLIKKDETTGQDKFKFVNQLGQTCSAFDETELNDWFTYFQVWDDNIKKFVNTEDKKSYRRCLKGEDKLISFMRECLSELNQKNPESSLIYNYKKLFKGDTKELFSDLQNEEFFRPFTVLINITTSEDGEKHYANLYMPSNNFKCPVLPSGSLKFINNGFNFPGWRKSNWKDYEKSLREYPPKGFFVMKELSVYNEADDVAAQKQTKKEEEPTSSSY